VGRSSRWRSVPWMGDPFRAGARGEADASHRAERRRPVHPVHGRNDGKCRSVWRRPIR
jgi:hypothetical protein